MLGGPAVLEVNHDVVEPGSRQRASSQRPGRRRPSAVHRLATADTLRKAVSSHELTQSDLRLAVDRVAPTAGMTAQPHAVPDPLPIFTPSALYAVQLTIVGFLLFAMAK